MTTKAVGRTHDARILIDSKNTVFVELDNVLGLTIGGETTVTNEYYLNEDYAKATVHAMGGGISFSTIYDGTNIDPLSALLLVPPSDPWDIMILGLGEVSSWQYMPVTPDAMGRNAPTDDAITRPWSLGRAGIGSYGEVIQPFSVTGTAKKVIKSNFGPTEGTTAGIVITNASNVTDITISGRTGVPVYTKFGPSIEMFNVAKGNNADLAMQLTGTSPTVSGYIVQGHEEALPNG